MPDEFQSEENSIINANVSDSVVDADSTANDSDSPESDPVAPQARVPAATASSYRDIIAERLARKVGSTQTESTRSPIAHSSDVERAVIQPAPAVERDGNESLTPEIEAATKLQEVTANGNVAERGSTVFQRSGQVAEPGNEVPSEQSGEAGISSRERARLRQQERASLRRGGAQQRRSPQEPIVSEEQPETGNESRNETPTDSAPVIKDPIAERLARKGGDRGEGRQRNQEPREPRRAEPRQVEPRQAEPRQEEARREEPRREEPRREESRREESRRDRGREPRPPMAEPEAGRPARPERKRPVGDEIRKREPSERSGAPTIGGDAITRPTPRRVIPEPRSTERSAPRTDAQKTEEAGHDAARSLALKLGISVIIPLYNEQDSLRELTAAIKSQCARLAGPKYEVIFVNDGSTDRSGEILQDILATSSRVTVLTFRRNLGKSAALSAGFTEAQYGIVITMDSDLQDDPREFTNLIAKLAQGYDLVSGWKKKRHDPLSKTGPSKFFNVVTSFFSGIRLHDFNCGLKAYRKEVTESLQVYGELHRFLPALAHWQGFRVTEIPVTHHPRKFGKSKFGSSRFFKGFLDLMSIVFTNRYGKRPLHLFGTVGTLMTVAGFVIDIWLTIQWALGMTSLSNRPLLLLGLLLILVGVQLISLGLLGEMIVKNSAANSRVSYVKEKGKPSAEARERRASRVAKMSRISGRPQGERRGPPRR